MYFMGIGAGVISGIIFCLLFFSMNSKAFAFSSSAGYGVFCYFGYKIIIEANINAANALPIFFGSYTLSMSLVVILAIIIAIIRFNKDDSIKTKFDFLEFLIGQKKAVDNFLEIKNQMRKNETSIDEINKQKSILNQQQATFTTQKKNFEDQIENGLKINLPMKHILPIDKRFIEYIPFFIEKITSLVRDLEELKQNYLKTFEEDRSRVEKYLESICANVGHHFFNQNDVRVQFHYLTDENEYKKRVAVYKGKRFEEELKILPCDNGMICQAGKVRRSLIKSLNIEHHLEGENDNKWNEYMVMVFKKFFNDDKVPTLTLSISIKNETMYKEILHFLNYCNIEEIIQEFLLVVKREIDLGDAFFNTQDTAESSQVTSVI